MTLECTDLHKGDWQRLELPGGLLPGKLTFEPPAQSERRSNRSINRVRVGSAVVPLAFCTLSSFLGGDVGRRVVRRWGFRGGRIRDCLGQVRL